MRLVYLLFLLISFSTSAQSVNDIKKVMAEQEVAWNNGDIDEFMEGYWKSDELKFVGANGVVKGWQSTLDRYHKSYPDRATMGILSFDIQEVEFFSKKSAWVLGKWSLVRPEKGDIGGYFTLIFKKIGKKWVIVSDHTS